MEKIKITQKEIDELYDIEKTEEVPVEENIANATFEEYTDYFDKKENKEMKENG